MASLVDMSLEDIITKKRAKQRNLKKGKPNNFQSNMPPNGNQKLPITDARNKIIFKKRTQITDAREKLAQLAKQKDARLKLEQLRQKKMILTKGMRRNADLPGRPDRGWMRTIHNRETEPTRQIRSQPRGGRMRPAQALRQQDHARRFMEQRTVEARRLDRMPAVKPILRTVENDVVIMEDDDDPMGGEYPLAAKSLNLKIVARNHHARDFERTHDARDRIGLDRRSAPTLTERSPPRLPSILKKRPMAALRERRPEPKLEAPSPARPSPRPAPSPATAAPVECRVIVSNLRNTVTDADIKELFGEIGGMVESRLIRAGIAEVIYRSQDDAQKAVDIYHNRQLDGQPMNCLLVAPRAPPPRGSSSKSALPASSSSNVEPDISTFHKVLFSHF